MRVLPYGQRQERSGLDPVLSPVGHRNARYQVTRESPDCQVRAKEERPYCPYNRLTGGKQSHGRTAMRIRFSAVSGWIGSGAIVTAAFARWPGIPITLRQGGRVIEDSRRTALGLG